MKRILALTMSLWLFSATFANAGGVIVKPRGSTFGDSIRIIGQWFIGNRRIALVTSDSCVNGEKLFTVTEVWLNHLTREITFNVKSVETGVPCGQ